VVAAEAEGRAGGGRGGCGRVRLAEKATAKALPEAAGLFCFGEPGAGAPGPLVRTGTKTLCKKTKQFCFGCQERAFFDCSERPGRCRTRLTGRVGGLLVGAARFWQ